MSEKRKYTPEQMANAIVEVQRGCPVAAAARKYSVPRVTLLYKTSGKSPKQCKMGPPSVLSATEEQLLVDWILSLASKQFPVTKEQLLDSVQKIMNHPKNAEREHPFSDGRPGRKWYEAFLRRHPEVTERVAQNLTTSRSNVSEQQIRSWFEEILKYLVSIDLIKIFNEPNRVFNGDESAFYLLPKGDKVLTRKGDKNVYSVGYSDEKENITVLITANAAGQFAPPLVVYAYERIPSSITEKVPEHFGIGKSESGWMCGSTFYEYITNVFHPWLTEMKIQRPIVYFCDGHASHMTLHLSEFCSENGIHLIALYPNSTHLMQPMDVSVFRPLKVYWKKEVNKWRLENGGEKMNKANFAPVLNEALKHISEDTIQNGFKACGLVPFDVEQVNFEKIASSKQQKKIQNKIAPNRLGVLQYVESTISDGKLLLFEQCLKDGSLSIAVEDTTFFEFWKNLKHNVLQNDSITSQENANMSIGESTFIAGNEPSSENVNIQFNNNSDPVPEVLPDNITTHHPEQVTIANPLPECSNNFNVVTLPKTQEAASSQEKESMHQPEIITASPNSITTCKKVTEKVTITVPSPFKNALFWPEETKSKKRKCKEKIPSVVTSVAWKSYHAKKEAEKKKKIEEKEERKKKRLANKEEKNAKKIKKQKQHTIAVSESSDDEDEVETVQQANSSDCDISDDDTQEFCELGNTTNLKVGDYALVKFQGGKRHSSFYRYVCVIQKVSRKGEIEVMSLKCLSESKKVFKMVESDVSCVSREAILGLLPHPTLCMTGDRIKYEFMQPVDVIECM